MRVEPQYEIAMFRPTTWSWAADVYWWNPDGEERLRIHCGRGTVDLDESLAEAGAAMKAHMLQQGREAGVSR